MTRFKTKCKLCHGSGLVPATNYKGGNGIVKVVADLEWLNDRIVGMTHKAYYSREIRDNSPCPLELYQPGTRSYVIYEAGYEMVRAAEIAAGISFEEIQDRPQHRR